MHDPDKLRRLPFSAAASIWLSTRKPYLKERSFYNLESSVRQLNKFFGPQTTCKIHIGNIREYQKARQTNAGLIWENVAGPSVINHEIVALQGVLSRCGEWGKIKPFYEPLVLPPPKKPKTMADEEEMLLWAVAVTDPDWELSYRIASLGVNTGACGAELRYRKLGDLFLEARQPGFHVHGETTKNRYRTRWVPLNETALGHMRWCLDRAHRLGARLPTQYLFPARPYPGVWNPDKPASSSWLRRSWQGMVQAAGIPHITPHCMRHQHATLSLEMGESEFNVAKRLGHRNPTMLREVYGHLRQDVQTQAVAALDPSVRFGPKRSNKDFLRQSADFG